jgi:hypothetical protein
LTEIIAQSYSNSSELTAKKSYNVHNHFYKYKFDKDKSGLYYLEQFQHLVHLKIMTDIPYEAILKVLAHTVDGISPDGMENEKKKRMFFPFSYYLHKSRLPDSPGFWKKYVK